MPSLITSQPQLDAALNDWTQAIGPHFQAYRNHCYYVLNVVNALAQPSAAELDQIAVAVAFHDIGIWSDKTLDYLDPSADRARAYLIAKGREADFPAIEAMIQGHHKFTRCKGEHARLAEAFRRADWNFVSLGSVPMGVPRTLRKQLLAAFPNAGFHNMLLKLGGAEFLRRPWKPLPMMRW
jgi:hypothetical protein